MNQLTDVAQSSLSSKQSTGPLKWVGMENMKIPLVGLLSYPVEAKLSALVSLSQANQRGIHMSRIYELAKNLSQSLLSKELILNCLDEMMASQKGSSNAAKLVIKTKALIERSALLSDKKGFKSYPIQITAQKVKDKISFALSVSVDYSSTCPCSAALSRELIAKDFKTFFKNKTLSLETAEAFLLDENTWPAWPHAQRSRAYGHFLLNETQEIPNFVQLIQSMEEALGTPTQTAVKRIDEQEFARLNARNLMFCEDAVRRLKNHFQPSDFKDFKFKVRHFESLHSHDVFAEARKS